MTRISRPAKNGVTRFRDAWRGLPHSPRRECLTVGAGAAAYSGAAHILTLIALYSPPPGESYAELNIFNPLYGPLTSTAAAAAATHTAPLPPLHLLLIFALQPLMMGVVAAAAERTVAGAGALLRWWMLTDALADTLTLIIGSNYISLTVFASIVAASSAGYAHRVHSILKPSGKREEGGSK